MRRIVEAHTTSLEKRAVIGCAGGCGAEHPVLEDMSKMPWEYLEITKRYRCWDCGRALERASTQPGAPPRLDVDRLPPDALGALKKLPERPPLHEKVKP